MDVYSYQKLRKARYKDMRGQSDIYRPAGKYFMVYWLPNQSRLFSDPKMFATDSKQEFIEKLEIAKRNRYEIDFATAI